MRPFLSAFAHELVKIAGPGMQGLIDQKMAPFKPAVPAPLQGPSATPAPAMPAPKPLEQRMSDSFGQIRAKASAAAANTQSTIKSPKTAFGVRG